MDLVAIYSITIAINFYFKLFFLDFVYFVIFFVDFFWGEGGGEREKGGLFYFIFYFILFYFIFPWLETGPKPIPW